MNRVDIARCSKRIAQYLWDPEPQNDKEPQCSIWCLGIEYSTHHREAYSATNVSKPCNTDVAQESQLGFLDLNATSNPTGLVKSASPEEPAAETTAAQNEKCHGWPENFLSDYESKFWMTYRSSFAPIPEVGNNDSGPSLTLNVRIRSQLMNPQGFTSDTGWGCMIRSGQSLLANTISMLQLGRDWRRGDRTQEEAKLISLFLDHPDAPFSIHRFVKHGAESCGKYPGEWFGPSATAKCIEILSNKCEYPNLRVYAVNDTPEIYQDDFMKIARDDRGIVQPTLILLGTMLGINRVTPVYWESLMFALKVPQSVGIAGGRPSASHYFIGTQGPYLFYLDPHLTRPALPYQGTDETFTKEDVDTYHTRRIRRIHVQDMDPSMLIGFLIKHQEDWEDWKSRVAAAPGKHIFHVQNERKPDHFTGREEALEEVEALDDFE